MYNHKIWIIFLLFVVSCSDKKDISDTKNYLDSIGKKYSLNILVNLRTLELSRATEISDEGLALLKEMKNLERLIIESSKVTDAGILFLKDIPNLKYLKLMNTPVGDSVVNSLKELKKLESLDLINTNVSEKGLEDLQNLLSNVAVICNTCQGKKLEELKAFLDSMKVNFSVDELKQVKKLFLSSKKIQEDKIPLLK